MEKHVLKSKVIISYYKVESEYELNYIINKNNQKNKM